MKMRIRSFRALLGFPRQDEFSSPHLDAIEKERVRTSNRASWQRVFEVLIGWAIVISWIALTAVVEHEGQPFFAGLIFGGPIAFVIGYEKGLNDQVVTIP
jgi:hypothetical protein